MKVGAWYQKGRGCEFIVWAPLKDRLEVKIVSPREQIIPLEKDGQGFWRGVAQDVLPGASYCLVIDGEIERPDPASFYQPQGVHEPSCIVNHALFSWNDHGWQGIPLEDMIMYELHVGAFSKEGTFKGAAQKIEHLKNLGVNAIEIMPVAQFPGGRNWGYDGVYPFAVQNTYGGPDGLKQLVDRCHQQGLAVILDVVYNHLGPEGNYLAEFAPYFTQKYQTPWGWAVNFDDKHSDGVRNYFIQNALYWFEHFHIDALRLDAVHGIFDFSAKHILRELAEKTEEFGQDKGRKHVLIAESDLNDVKVIEPKKNGGYGNDAQWLDDFHHALRTVITQDKSGYYCDFGKVGQLAKSYREGFVYDWAYSDFRKKDFGSSSEHIDPGKFIAFIQNHDQVGNRMNGERLSQLVDFEALKLAAGAVIFSPYIPMLFMGEEFAADTPFLYFISHLDADLVKAVQEGRKKEFSAFEWKGDPPDPFAQSTYEQSKLKWETLKQPPHKLMFEFYREMIRIRQQTPALKNLTRKGLGVSCEQESKTIEISRGPDQERVLLCMNFSKEKKDIPQTSEGKTPLIKRVDSADKSWSGPGSLAPEILASKGEIPLQPMSFVLYASQETHE